MLEWQEMHSADPDAELIGMDGAGRVRRMIYRAPKWVSQENDVVPFHPMWWTPCPVLKPRRSDLRNSDET